MDETESNIEISNQQNNPTPPQNKDISLSIKDVKDKTGLIPNLLDVNNLTKETESSKALPNHQDNPTPPQNKDIFLYQSKM